MNGLEETKQAVKYLKAARKLITPEGSWCKGCDARDAKGRKVEATWKEASSFCTIGALNRVLEHSTFAMGITCHEALHFSFGEVVGVANDKRSTKHLHVLMAYDFAILHAEDEVKRLRKLEKL